jgi:catechol 2,3-dioxygenase-like lactoylglutathione lyase family enzyme
MLDHVMLRVKDYAESKRFYDEVLGTLGYRMLMEFGESCGYGDDKPYFWIGEAPDPHPRTHIAFVAKSRAQVNAFHAKALELGAQSDGAPGLRLQYHPNYYGSFVIDPNGHNIEAVIHAPEELPRTAKASKAAKSKAVAKKAMGAAKKALSTAKKTLSAAAKKAGARKKKGSAQRKR